MNDLAQPVAIRCGALTRAGTQCRLGAGPSGFCKVHTDAAVAGPAVGQVSELSTAEAQEQSDELALLHDLGALGDAYQIEVSRMPGRVYLDMIPSSELSLDSIRDRFGGGKFVLRGRKDGHHFKGSKSVTVQIEGPAVSVGSAPAVNGQQQPPSAGVGTGTFAEMLAAIGAMQQASATTMAPLVEALVTRPAAPDPMDMALRLAEFIRDSKPEPSPYGDVIETVAKPLLEVISRSPLPGQPGATAAPNAPAIEPGATPEQPTPETYARAISDWLEPHRARGQSPGLWAEVFLEETGGEVGGSPELLAWACQAALHPQALDLWAAAVPVVGENREFYGLFLSELRDLLKDSDAPPDDTRGDPGDLGDGVAHGPPSETGGQD